MIPVAKQLQLLVDDGSLELTRELLLPKAKAPKKEDDDGEETALLK